MKKKKPSEAFMRDCYWLAKFYRVNPNGFLSQPQAAIRQHMKYSRELYQIILAQDEKDPEA